MSKWTITLELKGQLPSIKKQMNMLLDATAEEARREWIKLARQTLHSSANAYIGAIDPPARRGSTVTIKLSNNTPAGSLPNMLENGCAPFDMKPGLLKGKKAKTDKKGNKYVTVPLFAKSSGAFGGSPPVVPNPIYRQALKLSFGQSMNMPKKYEGWGLRTRLSADLKRWGHYTWKSSPFQGITRVQRFQGLTPLGLPREKAGALMTFRRVSSKSDPSSWIHPGFVARNIMDKVVAKMDTIFPNLLNSIVKGV